MMDRKPVVGKEIKGRNAYFTVSWSRLCKADKYVVTRSVPSEAGIYELYYMDEKEKLCLFHLGKSWYGGLRNEIRQRVDVELEKDPRRRELLEEHDCWYRWSLLSSSDDMDDILFFFAQTYLPGMKGVHHSGRYAQVFVKEINADKIVDI
jgi:hypothetical protein